MGSRRRPRGRFRIELIKLQLCGPPPIRAPSKTLLPNLYLSFYIIFLKEGLQNFTIFSLPQSLNPPLGRLCVLCVCLAGWLLTDQSSLPQGSSDTTSNFLFFFFFF